MKSASQQKSILPGAPKSASKQKSILPGAPKSASQQKSILPGAPKSASKQKSILPGAPKSASQQKSILPGAPKSASRQKSILPGAPKSASRQKSFLPAAPKSALLKKENEPPKTFLPPPTKSAHPLPSLEHRPKTASAPSHSLPAPVTTSKASSLKQPHPEHHKTAPKPVSAGVHRVPMSSSSSSASSYESSSPAYSSAASTNAKSVDKKGPSAVSVSSHKGPSAVSIGSNNERSFAESSALRGLSDRSVKYTQASDFHKIKNLKHGPSKTFKTVTVNVSEGHKLADIKTSKQFLSEPNSHKKLVTTKTITKKILIVKKVKSSEAGKIFEVDDTELREAVTTTQEVEGGELFENDVLDCPSLNRVIKALVNNDNGIGVFVGINFLAFACIFLTNNLRKLWR